MDDQNNLVLSAQRGDNMANEASWEEIMTPEEMIDAIKKFGMIYLLIGWIV